VSNSRLHDDARFEAIRSFVQRQKEPHEFAIICRTGVLLCAAEAKRHSH